jgi:hypothetical protein
LRTSTRSRRPDRQLLRAPSGPVQSVAARGPGHCPAEPALYDGRPARSAGSRSIGRDLVGGDRSRDRPSRSRSLTVQRPNQKARAGASRQPGPGACPSRPGRSRPGTA